MVIVNTLIVIMLIVIMLIVFMLIVVMLIVNMLIAIMLIVIMLSVVASFHLHQSQNSKIPFFSSLWLGWVFSLLWLSKLVRLTMKTFFMSTRVCLRNIHIV